MRGPWLVFAAMAAAGIQAAPSGQRLVVIVDGDAPAADPEAAARLRAALFARVDAPASAAYFVLTSDGLTAVPAAEALSIRSTVFTVTPPRHSGVAITYTESVEVLRGNEAVRETVIARECPPAQSGCAGLVHSAVNAEVRRVEAASAAKLRRLVSAAAGWRESRVVVLTSGWPARDDSRVALSRAVRDLRERGVSLVVVRVPPREPYRGLVRDASESLAAQLPAGFAALADDTDVEPAATLIGVAAAAVDEVALAPPAAVPADTLTDVPTAAAADVHGPAKEPAGDAALDDTLRKAAAYVARFQRTFTGVLWHERYQQEDRVWRRFGSSGATTSAIAGRRTLEAELFFAWLPQDATWISVRDVISVDGTPRPPRDRRLASLATRSTVSLPELRELARENGRFNIGQIVRTFNEPTLALLLLDDRHVARVAFSRKGRQRVEGRELVSYAFVERGRPTLVQNQDRDVPVRGTFEIDEATGEIWKSHLEIVDPFRGLDGHMDVDYQRHVAFDVLVPGEMRESYTSAGIEQVTAVATYSEFRRFQTTGRLILTP